MAAAGGLAAIVHLLAADTARQALRFTFPGVPDRAGEALAILADNARIAATILLVAALRGLPAAEARHPPLSTLAAGCCDAIVVLVCLTNVAVVGAALGAYGARMAEALLPHGPVELAAFALPLGLYLQGRRHPITRPAAGGTATVWPDAARGGCDRRDLRLTAFCRRMGVGEPAGIRRPPRA